MKLQKSGVLVFLFSLFVTSAVPTQCGGTLSKPTESDSNKNTAAIVAAGASGFVAGMGLMYAVRNRRPCRRPDCRDSAESAAVALQRQSQALEESTSRSRRLEGQNRELYRLCGQNNLALAMYRSIVNTNNWLVSYFQDQSLGQRNLIIAQQAQIVALERALHNNQPPVVIVVVPENNLI